jgi:hypothetical protein
MLQSVRVFRRRVREPVSDMPVERPARIDWSESAILGCRSAAARDLADLVASRMVGSALPWSDRQYVFRQAAKKRIARFEANLIIAAVQNRLADKSGAAPAKTGARKPRTRIPVGWITFGVVQGAIVLAAWRVLFS